VSQVEEDPVVLDNDMHELYVAEKKKVLRTFVAISERREEYGAPGIDDEELKPLVYAAAALAADNELGGLMEPLQLLVRTRRANGAPVPTPTEIKPILQAAIQSVDQEELQMVTAVIKEIAQDRDLAGLPKLSSDSLVPMLIIYLSDYVNKWTDPLATPILGRSNPLGLTVTESQEAEDAELESSGGGRSGSLGRSSLGASRRGLSMRQGLLSERKRRIGEGGRSVSFRDLRPTYEKAQKSANNSRRSSSGVDGQEATDIDEDGRRLL